MANRLAAWALSLSSSGGAAMARAMTPAEQQQFKGFFPNLDVNKAVVTGEVSTVYNCISWTVGVTNRWLWPGNTLANFDNFYRAFGFVRTGAGPDATRGHSTTKMDPRSARV